MTEVRCSLCPNVIIRCTNYTQVLPMAYVICRNCSINGYLKREVIKTYDLVQNAVHQQLINDRVKLENEFEKIKKRIYKDQNVVFDTLIKSSTYEFAQQFCKFRDNILKVEPDLEKTVRNSSEKILDVAEIQLKRLLIEEVKMFNQILKKEEGINRSNVENVQKLGQEIKRKVATLAYESMRQEANPKDGKPIFTPDQINELMAVFNKKTGQMDSKTGNLAILFHEGSNLLTSEGHLNALAKASEEIRKVDEEEVDQ